MNKKYNFLVKPFWVFSHIFVLSVSIGMLFLSVWQFQRLAERKEINESLSSNISSDSIDYTDIDNSDLNDEYLKVNVKGKILDSDFIRIISKTNNGMTGQHVIALLKTDNDELMFVNRGFIEGEPETVAEVNDSDFVGYLRLTQEKGFFGLTDDLNSDYAPRVDINSLGKRLDNQSKLSPYWLQLESPSNDVVALEAPEISEGSHLSYAIQWIIFSILTMIFYIAILYRKIKSLS